MDNIPNIPKFVGFRGDGQSTRRLLQVMYYLFSAGLLQLPEKHERKIK
jgi:hypothetical protein